MLSGDKILIVEDEKLLRMTLGTRLRGEGYSVREAESGAEAVSAVRDEEPDLMLLDYRLPDMTGIDVLRQVRETAPDITIILMTAFSSIDSAVEAMKLGAHDYLNKPVNYDDLVATLSKALETTRLRREVRRHRTEQQKLYGISNIVGHSKAIQDVLMMIRKVAESAASTVLIMGDSGSGKDLVAKAIHYASDRADKPFMNITCTAIPETLLESELFGHERGAFTDARSLKKGPFELANGGTVFLDEIGDMGLTLQSKLLRFLDQKTFRRVGGDQDIRVDLRVIAATNRDLDKGMREGRFREDLFYRLNVVPILIPPLKKRKEDIPDLVNHFIDQFNREFRKRAQHITPDALACLMRYSWPGNVRELRNVIERMMILEDREELDVADLPAEILGRSEAERAGDNSPGAWSDEDEEAPADDATDGETAGMRLQLPEEGVSLREVQRELIRQALERTGGNQTRAARLLRISRDALRYKMKSFGLS